MKGAASLFFAACFILLSSWASPGDSEAVGRCRKYLPQVIREARFHIGMDAPYWLFMGQIEQESGCRAGITSFDGGAGLGQFMPATADWLHSREGTLREISLRASPCDPRWSIRAIVLYDRYLHRSAACKGWYFTLRAYNGGVGNLNREIMRAGSCNIHLVERQCARRAVRLKSGNILDLCRVNIQYPRQVSGRGEKYR